MVGPSWIGLMSYRRSSREISSPFHQVRIQELCHPEEDPHQTMLDPGSPVSKTVRNKFIFYKLTSLWYFVTATQKNENRCLILLKTNPSTWGLNSISSYFCKGLFRKQATVWKAAESFRKISDKKQLSLWNHAFKVFILILRLSLLKILHCLFLTQAILMGCYVQFSVSLLRIINLPTPTGLPSAHLTSLWRPSRYTLPPTGYFYTDYFPLTLK